MNENNEIIFNDEDIVAYLLGTASAELTERFDELSITSDEFAEALAAADADLVDSYANGEMLAADRMQFESHFLKNRSAISKLTFAEAFRDFGSRETQAPREVLEIEKQSATDGFFVSAIRYLRWGFAATAAALLLLALWIYFGASGPGDELSRNVNSQISSPRPIDIINGREEESQPEIAQSTNGIADNSSIQNNLNVAPKNTKPTQQDETSVGRVFAFALSPPLRSSNSASEIAIPKDTVRVSVRLEIESDEFKSYKVRLIGPSNNEVWRAASIRSANSRSGRSITVSIPASSIRMGMYRFSVAGVRANGESESIGDYPFRVVQ
jgi:hypothetical protein